MPTIPFHSDMTNKFPRFPMGRNNPSLNDPSMIYQIRSAKLIPHAIERSNRRETEEEHMDQSRFKPAPAILFTFPFPRGSFVPPSGAKGDVGRGTGGGWQPPRG